MIIVCSIHVKPYHITYLLTEQNGQRGSRSIPSLFFFLCAKSVGTQGSHDNKQLLDGVEHNIMNYAEVWVNFANSASLLQIFQKMYNKTITEFGLRTILGILNTDTRFDSSRNMR